MGFFFNKFVFACFFKIYLLFFNSGDPNSCNIATLHFEAGLGGNAPSMTRVSGWKK